MGSATKAIIRLGTPISQIEHAILHKYGNVEVQESRTVGMYHISLKKGNAIWSMFIDFNNTADQDISGVCMSSRASQLSIEVMEHLCQIFGGYLDQNDCDDEPYYSINNDLYLQGVEPTPMDLFRHRVVNVFGYNKLGAAIELLKEYRELTELDE